MSKLVLLGRLIGIRGVRGRRVDPDGGGQLLGGWRFALEAPGLASKAALGPVAGRDDGRCAAGVDIGRGEEGDPRVAVFVVVPGEEDLAMATGVLDGAAAVREVRSVLQGLEVRLAEGIVVAGVGSAVWKASNMKSSSPPPRSMTRTSALPA